MGVPSGVMASVTQLLDAAAAGDSRAAADLLPLVYDELRKLAAVRMAAEKPGLTLDATALVHEAYIRLVDGCEPVEWNTRGHFFAAAAEAMRRILIDRARRNQATKRGGDMRRLDLDEVIDWTEEHADRLLDLDEALSRFKEVDPQAASLVELRFFGGLSMRQVAEVLGLPLRTVERNWTFARTWLHRELSKHQPLGQ